MENISKQTANYLLSIKAVKLQPNEPFTWASGWKSPIYCDNRQTLSYPEVRKFLRDSFVHLIKEKYPDVEVIAGVATGAIAIGVLVAEAMDLPFIYIRSSSKGHGLQNQIEGHYEAGQKVVVIEDLVSTGGSSLKAVDALKSADCNVLGMMAIFTYGFETAENNFKEKNIELTTLSNYKELLKEALNTGYITENQVETLNNWRKQPAEWGK